MDKIWLIIIDGISEGPYSITELKRHRQFTPDTLAKHIYAEHWVQARFIPELTKVFEDDEPEETGGTEEEPTQKEVAPNDEIVIDWREPPQFFWLIVVLVLLTYTLFQLMQTNQ